MISRRNVVANSGSHAGVSAVSNSMIKKAGILALAATLALASVFSFSKAFAGGLLGGGRVDFSRNCDSEGYQTFDWKTYVTVDDGGNVTNIEMYYLDKPENLPISGPRGDLDRFQGASPIRISPDSYKWIYSLFNDDVENYFYLDAEQVFPDTNGMMYPLYGVFWKGLKETDETGHDYLLRKDLLDEFKSTGSLDLTFDIPFERQTKVDVTFDYGYEGSTPYVMTLDWADYNLERRNAVTIPIPSRDGYEFLGWNEGELYKGEKYYADFSDVVKVWDFYISGLYTGNQVIKGYWKQVDSTNDIDVNDDQTDSADTDINADTPEAADPDAVNAEADANNDNAEAADSSQDVEGTKEGDQADQTV